MSSRVPLFLASIIVVLSPLSLQAQELNIDLGNYFGGPSDAYGAAAGQAGRWNTISSLGVTPNLVDTATVPTPVSITVSAGDPDGWVGACVIADAKALVSDNVYTTNGTWTVSLAGLTNGTYEVFLYAPGNSSVATGSMLVNGHAVASISGDVCGLNEGEGWVSVVVTVQDGTLTVMGDSTGTGFAHAGLAGLQLKATAAEIFTDGFESGNTSAWSSTVD